MKAFRDWSLTARQNFALISLLLVIIGGVFVLIRLQVWTIVNREINQTATFAATLSAQRINQPFPVVMAAAGELAATLEITAPDEAIQRKLLTATFERVRKLAPALCGISIARVPYSVDPGEKYFMLYVYEKGGEVRVERIGGDDYQYEKFDWFVVPHTLNRPIWTEPYFDRFAEVEMTTFSQPLYLADGTFAGVTGFDLSLAGIGKMAEEADAFDCGSEYLLSRFGQFVAFPQMDREANCNPVFNSTIFSMADSFQNKTFADSEDAALLTATGREMLAGHNGNLALNILTREDNTAERFFYTPVPAPGWSLGVAYPEARLVQPLTMLEYQLFLLSSLGLLLMFLTVTIINRHLTRPLAQLARAAESIGAGNFNPPLPPHGGDDEIGRLNNSFRRMQQALGEYIEELKSSTAARQKIESELEVARQIQLGILPKMLPPLPNAPEFSLYATLRPARAVGGDLYDFFPLDAHHYCFIIGDVSGKGVPAALFMAVTQTLQRSESARLHDPGELATRVNTLLAQNNDSLMFVTYFIGVLDLRDGTVTYCNAGHNPPYVMRSNGTLELLTTRHGPALGVVEEAKYAAGTLSLAPGDTLVLYTDGVVEALDPQQNEFGVQALQRVLARHTGATPAILGQEIVTAVDRFADGAEQADDITLLILKLHRKIDSKPENSA